MNRDDKTKHESDGVGIPLPVLRVINKSWDDPEFKRRLLADPVSVLRAEGVDLPKGVRVRVIEDAEKTLPFVLPNQQGAKNFTGQSLAAEGASIMYSRDLPASDAQ
jgi:Nitrile hydratase, alpha chain